MWIDSLVFAAGLLVSSFVFYNLGKKSKQTNSYWKGRGEGWKACENMVIDRATKSKKIDLTEEEAWEELVQ